MISDVAEVILFTARCTNGRGRTKKKNPFADLVMLPGLSLAASSPETQQGGKRRSTRGQLNKNNNRPRNVSRASSPNLTRAGKPSTHPFLSVRSVFALSSIPLMRAVCMRTPLQDAALRTKQCSARRNTFHCHAQQGSFGLCRREHQGAYTCENIREAWYLVNYLNLM